MALSRGFLHLAMSEECTVPRIQASLERSGRSLNVNCVVLAMIDDGVFNWHGNIQVMKEDTTLLAILPNSSNTFGLCLVFCEGAVVNRSVLGVHACKKNLIFDHSASQKGWMAEVNPTACRQS